VIEMADHLKAVGRELSRADGRVVGVLLRRAYEATAEDVWDAITDPDRLRRWFMPVSGDLREGGHFQLEGNAGGDVLTCTPPELLEVTFGGESSVVRVRLTPEGGRTVVELEHTVPPEMAAGGTGALYVGPGWDGGLLGLALFLSGRVAEGTDPVAMADTEEAQEYSLASIDLWAAVVEAEGDSTPGALADAVGVAKGQFSPDLG
jgi:uncharacterized protein YndB with AHSA1/START domain